MTHVQVSNGRALGVTTADGTHIPSRVVLADCDVTTLMTRLVGLSELPTRYVRGIRRFQRGASTFKIDWAVSTPVPWSDPEVVGAGTVNIADTLDELTLTSAQLAMRQIPDKPFLLLGQMTAADRPAHRRAPSYCGHTPTSHNALRETPATKESPAAGLLPTSTCSPIGSSVVSRATPRDSCRESLDGT